jgi:capsular polysaccharide transport system permease protein
MSCHYQNNKTDMCGTLQPTLRHEGKVSIRAALQRKRNVMHAVILRDIRSRYFDHGLGFLIVPLFPVAHMMILILIYKIVDRQTIFGDDIVLFFATGLIPVLMFNYVSRFMSVSLLANKGMLAFPAVKLLDIVLARSVLELFGIVLSILFVLLIVVLVGSNPSARSTVDVVLVIGSVAILSIGVGIVVSVISVIWPFFAMFYGLFTVIIYLASGAPIYLQAFPEVVVYYCSFNPLFHAVEWVRSAYYLGYPSFHLSKTYLVSWSFCSLSVGLLLERCCRRFISG